MSRQYHQNPSPRVKDFIKMGKRRARIGNIILALVLTFIFLSNVPDVNRSSAVEYQEPIRTFRLPGQGNCSMAGAWDGQFYYSIDSNCYSSTLLIYKLNQDGVTLYGQRDIVDSVDKRPIMISNLTWDPKRNKIWAAHAKSVYLVTMVSKAQVNGEPKTNHASAEKMFLMERSGSYAIGGMAYDVGDDSLYVVPDSHPRIYHFRLNAKIAEQAPRQAFFKRELDKVLGKGWEKKWTTEQIAAMPVVRKIVADSIELTRDSEALIRILTPKEDSRILSSFSRFPQVSKIRMSGIAVAGDNLIVGVNKNKKMITLNKSDGIILSERYIDVEMFGSITCLMAPFGKSPDEENVMIKAVYGGSLQTYYVNDIQCHK